MYNHRRVQNKNRQPEHKPKPPPGFKYVSTEVLVPIPPQESQLKASTTYVTNYVYHGDAATSSRADVGPFKDMEPPPPHLRPHHMQPSSFVPVSRPVPTNPFGVSWEMLTPESAERVSSRAVVGGYEGWDGSPLWVIRARHANDVVPGKLAIKHKVAYIPFAGSEQPVQNIEVLCMAPGKYRWIPSSNGLVPSRAIPGGNTASGETLFIGRANYSNSVTPGKIHTSHGTCYISFGGKEVSVKTYDVLCKVL